jgi:hypothetical protein
LLQDARNAVILHVFWPCRCGKPIEHGDLKAVKAGLRRNPAGGMVMTDSAACFAATTTTRTSAWGRRRDEERF